MGHVVRAPTHTHTCVHLTTVASGFLAPSNDRHPAQRYKESCWAASLECLKHRAVLYTNTERVMEKTSESLRFPSYHNDLFIGDCSAGIFLEQTQWLFFCLCLLSDESLVMLKRPLSASFRLSKENDDRVEICTIRCQVSKERGSEGERRGWSPSSHIFILSCARLLPHSSLHVCPIAS